MQHVPEHVLSTIISYVTGCTKYRAHLLTAEPPVLHRRLSPFLQLSRAWRYAACTFQYKITTVDILPASPHAPRYLSLSQTRQVNAEEFVRHIYVTMTCQQVINGHASKALEQLFSGRPLLGAKQLVLRILPASTLGDQWIATSKQDRTSGRRFGALLREYLPGIRTIMVSFTSFSFNIHPLLMVEHLCASFDNLMGVAIHVNHTGPLLRTGPQIDFCPDVTIFTGLSHIVIDESRWNDMYIELVRRNSQTLRCMHLLNTSSNVYPRVATLDNRLRVDYPNLSLLDIRTERFGLPFADQLVLKGNPFDRLDTTRCWVGTTPHHDDVGRPCIEMRTLKLALDCYLFPEIIYSGLLNWTACENLTTVKFRVYMTHSSQSFVAQMMVGIINRCQKIENIHCWDFCDNVGEWLPRIQPNVTIRRLEVPNIYFYLSEVGTLLRRLPLLRSLSISMHKIPSIKPMESVLTDAEIAGVHMLMAGAHSTDLRELTLGGMKFNSDERAGDIAVALASVCRKLKFLTIDFFFSANANTVYSSAKRATQRPIYTQTLHLHSLVIRNISKPA